MHLTEANYYGVQANLNYMSASQYKAFLKCEACAIAEINMEYERPKSDALLLGSYVDEVLTGTPESLEKFIERNPDMFVSRGANKGQLKAEFKKANETIAKIHKQPLMMYLLSGEHQTIMTGSIEGVPIKIKMDSYKEGEFIADLKYVKDLRSPNLFESMIKYWNYDLQLAIYEEVVFQNTGKHLPCYLVIATKEKVPRVAVAEVKPWNLEAALNDFKKNAPRFQAIKNGDVEPERCEICDYCADTVILVEPIDSDHLGLTKEQMKYLDGNE